MSTLQNYDDLYVMPEESAEEKQARLDRLEIARLKSNLAKTDYIALKLAEGAAAPEEYAEELAHRAYWRSRINELEASDG